MGLVGVALALRIAREFFGIDIPIRWGSVNRFCRSCGAASTRPARCAPAAVRHCRADPVTGASPVYSGMSRMIASSGVLKKRIGSVEVPIPRLT